MRGGYVLCTDPGPDPDDAKAILSLAMLDLQGELELLAVIANGGGSPDDRATLARCLLDHVGATHVPVGVGSAGKPTTAAAHEYAIDGYACTDRSRLEDGRLLLLRVLTEAPPKSITLVCISALTDFAAILRERPELVLAKVREVAIQGGMERTDGVPIAPGEPLPAHASAWRPDASANNLFDMRAAEAAYAFCLAHGLPMSVVNRKAVPMLPMQLAHSFAVSTGCPVARYLADSQFKGLEALWIRVCNGQLPARCTKRWFMSSFCGVDAARFDAERLDELDASSPIAKHLHGFVMPYDVIAVMSVLAATRESATPALIHGAHGATHRLFLSDEHMLDGRVVARLLGAVFQQVTVVTAAIDAVSEAKGGARGGGGLVRALERERAEMRGRTASALLVRLSCSAIDGFGCRAQPEAHARSTAFGSATRRYHPLPLGWHAPPF
jgi:hypothetical protein